MYGLFKAPDVQAYLLAPTLVHQTRTTTDARKKAYIWHLGEFSSIYLAPAPAMQ